MLLPLALSATLDAPILSGNCNPTRVHFMGHITSDVPAKVTYTWTRPNQPASRTFTLEFTQAGTLPISYDLFFGKAEDGWVMLRVLLPEKADSPRVKYQVKCGK